MTSFRPMTMDDADFMLELKNYEETRDFAIFSHDVVKREDHIKFLEKNVDQFRVIFEPPDTSTNIKLMNEGIEIATRSVGAFRINGLEVSIWISRRFRGKQIALKTLNQIKFKGMIARIVDGNIASMRTFVKAGFIPKDHKDNYYILEKP